MQIMAMPEYYLTRAETDIFTTQSNRMIKQFGIEKDVFFELIELGAGDGSKTKLLLKALLDAGYRFDYIPIDISANVLDHLERTLKSELPNLSIRPQNRDYFRGLKSFKNTQHPKVVLYLGSNLGNLSDEQAAEFIYGLGKNLSKGDRLLLGVDKIKSADIVLPAYNDSQGITRDFNLNLLTRINRELGGNFDINKFIHLPEYDEDKGVAKSSLQSQSDQQVYIEALDETYHFERGEKIHTEISRKYNTQILRQILKDTDFVISDILTDSQQYFSNYILLRT